MPCSHVSYLAVKIQNRSPEQESPGRDLRKTDSIEAINPFLLDACEEPNYKVGILFLFPILEEREIPPPLPRQFSVEGETSNTL